MKPWFSLQSISNSSSSHDSCAIATTCGSGEGGDTSAKGAVAESPSVGVGRGAATARRVEFEAADSRAKTVWVEGRAAGSSMFFLFPNPIERGQDVKSTVCHQAERDGRFMVSGDIHNLFVIFVKFKTLKLMSSRSVKRTPTAKVQKNI